MSSDFEYDTWKTGHLSLHAVVVSPGMPVDVVRKSSTDYGTMTALKLTVTRKSCALHEAELQGDWEKTRRGAFLSMSRYSGFGMHYVIIREESGTQGTTPAHPRVPGVTDWLAEWVRLK